MLKFFSEITLNESSLYGGKGASLGELSHLGITVPPGFVFPTNLLNIDEHQAEILEAFEKLDTQYVAVRSSANVEDGDSHSFAGQFETYLFVEKHHLLEKMKRCLDMLHSDRVTAYCEAMGIQQKDIKLAIVVQKMIQSESAGVCFTMNPMTQDPEEGLIEACFGQGEALVSGLITPDNYLIKNEKITKTINSQNKQLVFDFTEKKLKYVELEKSIQDQQKIHDDVIKKIVEISGKIRDHYGKPMDIEWALENGTVSILQARPITHSASPQTQTIPQFNPNDYDHLWEWGAPYLIAQLDAESMTARGKWDFISSGTNGKTTLYVSKKDRQKLSEDGFSTYYDGCQEYETMVRKQIQEISDQLEILKKTDFSVLSNETLADMFETYIGFIYQIGLDYAVTETFSTDIVEKILVHKDQKYDIQRLHANTQKIGELKLEQRSLLNTLWDYKEGILAKYLTEIGKRVQLQQNPIEYHYRELLRLLNGEKISIPDRSIWIQGRFSQWKDVLGNDAQTLIQSLTYTDENTEIIHGTCSNVGRYIGKVRKIEFDIATDYKKEIAEMEKGEVLVSGSTGPELILACQKAGAIVTEEGGVISHAAIISRELGIPCITGTHIACKILHTGDLIEVNADEGIVKILERAVEKV